MLTKWQQDYLDILKPEKAGRIVSIQPYNPLSSTIAERTVGEVRARLPEADVRCMGSNMLGIAGENDADVFVLIQTNEKDSYIEALNTILLDRSDKEKSQTHLHKWHWFEQGVEVNVYLTNKDEKWFQEQVRTCEKLSEDPELVKEYERLKLSCNGKTWKEYKIAKYEFYNKILGLKK